MAISAAASIPTFVLEEEDMRRALVGTPLYVHMTIAFASVFLMKIAARWNRVMGLNVESRYVSHLLDRMIVLLKFSVTSDRHLLHHISFGLEKMLVKLGLIVVAAAAASAGAANANTTATTPTAGAGVTATDTNREPQKTLQAAVDDDDGNRTASKYEVSPGHDSVISYGQMEYGAGALPENTMLLPGDAAGSGGVGWDPYGANGGSGMAAATTARQDYFNDYAVMNDSLLYEAFGTESANDIYNLLASRSSY